MNREQIYSALFTVASSAPGLITSSRKLRHWTDLEPGAMPALFLAQGDQIAQRTTRMPARWLLRASLYIYVHTEGETSPASSMNPILDYLTEQLDDPFPGVPQTLGGLVEYARIEGAIETDEGVLGSIAVAIIPIVMLTT